MKLNHQLARNAQNTPEKPAIIYHDQIITYSALERLTNQVANFLLREGIQKGDCVGLLLNKTPEALISFLATVKIGGIVTPLNYKFTKQEMEYVLNLTQPKMVIAEADHLTAYIDLIERYVPKAKQMLVGEVQSSKFKMENSKLLFWDSALAKGSNLSLKVAVSADDVVYLNFTSGSTGLPKAAVTTQRNLFWNTVSSIESLRLTADDIHLCLFPIYGHPHEIICRPLYLGGTLVLEDRISPKSIVHSIACNKVTALMAAPTFLEMLLPIAENKEFNFSTLRILEAGGMHATDGLAKRVTEHLQGFFLPVWGSTETTGIAVANRVELPRPLGSVGTPCPYYEIKVVDEQEQDCPAGEVGEMYIRGPAVVNGYFNAPEETRKSFTEDRWYRTDDLVKVDKEGYYYFLSRKSGMMKVAGMKVYPTEIENVLSLHPQIAQVAVIAQSDIIRGEIPIAVVVPKLGAQVTETEIKQFCHKYLSDYKIPRLIKIQSELPKTASGKVDLKTLKRTLLERETGLEPATTSLGSWHSTN